MSHSKHQSRLVFICTMLVLAICFSGCVTSGSFSTGRTLKPGQFNLVAGVQQIVSDDEKGIKVISEAESYIPRIGVNIGMPAGFEYGMHWLVTQGIETGLRFELTPEGFDWFDLAVGYMYGVQIGGRYQKYGITISQELDNFEPYIYYSRYRQLENDWDNFFGGIFKAGAIEAVSKSRSLGFGLAVPLFDNVLRIVPEVRYDWYEFDSSYDGEESEPVILGFASFWVILPNKISYLWISDQNS
jgi:hypothetical protein